MSMIFVFPGQGSQCVGMGREVFSAFPSARAVFLEVDEALGENFSRRLFHGPEAFLTRTENAQPGLFAVCMAIFRSLEAEFGISLSVGSFAAGHSLGEYTALAAVGSLGISDGARLLRLRGRLMQSAVGEGCGAMVAILGLDWNGAVALAEEASRLSGEVCEATNDNSMHQVVLGGTRSGISRACALARAFWCAESDSSFGFGTFSLFADVWVRGADAGSVVGGLFSSSRVAGDFECYGLGPAA